MDDEESLQVHHRPAAGGPQEVLWTESGRVTLAFSYKQKDRHLPPSRDWFPGDPEPGEGFQVSWRTKASQLSPV